MNDKFSAFLKSEIDNLNRHLPIKIFSFTQILRLKQPGFLNKNREFIQISPKEIKLITDKIPKSQYSRLEVPTFLTRRRDMGSGVYIVGGTIINLYLIKSCLQDSFEEYDLWKIGFIDEQNERIIGPRELRIIRRLFPTNTVIALS